MCDTAASVRPSATEAMACAPSWMNAQSVPGPTGTLATTRISAGPPSTIDSPRSRECAQQLALLYTAGVPKGTHHISDLLPEMVDERVDQAALVGGEVRVLADERRKGSGAVLRADELADLAL